MGEGVERQEEPKVGKAGIKVGGRKSASPLHPQWTEFDQKSDNYKQHVFAYLREIKVFLTSGSKNTNVGRSQI
jgi:hypothetical protein